MKKVKGRCLAAVAASILALVGCTGKPRVLRLYIWQDDVAPQVVEAFERKYGCIVKAEFYDSNEAMIERLRTDGPGCCDLIEPSGFMIGQLVQEGLIVPLDHAKCPSVKQNFQREFAKVVPGDPELEYAVPYNISSSGFIYATNCIPKGIDVDTWAIMGNPAFKGRIALLDDMREVISGGLIFLGYSANSEDEKAIEAAVEQTLKWLPNIDHWDSDGSQKAVGDGRIWLAHAYSGWALPFILGTMDGVRHPGLAFAHPREGFVISCEELAVTSGCKNPDLAHAFLEFLYAEAKNGRDFMNYGCTLMPCRPAIESLDPEFRKLVEPTPEDLARGQVLKGFNGKLEVQALYEKAWERIVKAR